MIVNGILLKGAVELVSFGPAFFPSIRLVWESYPANTVIGSRLANMGDEIQRRKENRRRL